MKERIDGLPLVSRLIGCVIAGVLGGLAFQPFNLWWTIFPAVAIFTLAIKPDDRIWATLLLGLGFGLALSGTTLNWMNAIFLEAMFAIVIAVALFYVALALALRFARRVAWWPVLVSACWTLQEMIICRWPFDGFGWIRLGYTQIDSPLVVGYPFIGVVGIGFLVALLAQGLAWLILRPKQWWMTVGIVVAVAVFCLAVVFIPTAPIIGNSLAVGWVQGGAPGGGVYGLGEARTITKNETAGTQSLAAEVVANKLPKPDFVVWPENGTDLDPFKDAQTLKLVQDSLKVINVPILIGTILDGPGENERQTASLWWEPGQDRPSAVYVKRGIVPFGEWVPFRDILEPLIPKLAYVGRQSVAGTEPGVLPVNIADGNQIKLGVLTCYDVSFDEYVYDTVRFGGELIVIQSSNAMYQGTGQIDQQFAISRVRAAELKREILVVTTSGVSGFIGPGGEVTQEVPASSAAHGVVEMQLNQGSTPVLQVAPILELCLSWGAVLGLFAAFLLSGGRSYGTMKSRMNESESNEQ